uniref:BHLH domain-containing protein n=1 Tax=Mesocestoides corti TaxID=53468 RepID=A0A5K3EV60_MESCO
MLFCYSLCITSPIKLSSVMFYCRRDHHNHLERKRRASIKGSYSELREAIPSLRGSKASRAVTLQRAVEYIETLTKANREHTKCVDDLTRQNELLEQQIQELYHDYQCLEGNEYTAAQSAAAETSVAAATLTQAGPPAPFNTNSSPAHPTAMPSAASCNVTSSTGSSVPASTAPTINGSYNNTTTSPGGFSIPLRVVPQHHLATENNPSPSDDQPQAMIPTSGLAQLSYAALHLQQKLTPPNTPTVTKSPVSTSTVVATNPPSVARLITVESSTAVPTPSSRITATVPQRIRLSNSLSAGGGKPVVVVPSSGSSTASATFSALDTAVLKARTARPPLDHVVVGSNVEVVSSSSSNMAPSSSSGHPRRVVIVSAQHQECSSPDTVTQK